MDYLKPKNLAFFFIIGILVFFGIIIIGDYRKIAGEMGRVTIWMVITVVSLVLMNNCIRFMRWTYFLKISQINIPFTHSFLIYFSGLMMVITPAKVGEVMKSQLLKMSDDIPRRNSLMIVVAERFTDIIGLSILALFGAISFFNQIYYILPVIMLIAIAIIVLTNERCFMVLVNLGERIPVVKNYTHYAKDLHSSSTILFSPVPLFISVILSVLSWSFECLALYFLIGQFGYDIGFLQSMFIFAFSSIFGSLLVLPGGLGAAEGSFIVLLSLMKIPLPVASIITILFRLCSLFFGVIIGLISFFILDRTVLRKKGQAIMDE